MDVERKIKDLASSEGFDRVVGIGSWRGFDVFVADTDAECAVGLPQYILVSGNNVRWATVEETEELMASVF